MPFLEIHFWRYRIRHRMSNMLFRIRHRMSITEYRYRIRYRMSNIRCRIFDTPISYIKKYTTSYTITCIRHTISYTTSYKMYDIVCFWGGSCHFYIRRRIRRRIKKYDVVYDMQLLVAILRYRTYISYASSLYYVIVRQNRKKNTI